MFCSHFTGLEDDERLLQPLIDGVTGQALLHGISCALGSYEDKRDCSYSPLRFLCMWLRLRS